MTFLKKHAVKILVVLLIFVLLFLLWYHLFPVKIPFDHTLYSEKGEEYALKGELQYYRSIFSKGGKLYGEVSFGDKKYTAIKHGSTPFGFSLCDLEGEKILTLRNILTINFTEKDYSRSFFVTESLYPSGKAENYFLTKPDFYIENSDLAVVDKPRIHINTNKDIVIVYDNDVQVLS